MKFSEKPRKTEWPTLALIFASSAAVFLLTYYAAWLSIWLVVPSLSIVLALHSSLQHEVLHGHPTRSNLVNELLVCIGFGLFLPYRRFRDTHMQHHFDPDLTDPYDDPESNFQDPAKWAKTGGLHRRLLLFNNTLAGRMLVGPLMSFSAFYIADIGLMKKGDKPVLLAYFLHFLGLVPFVFWLIWVNTLPIPAYILAAYLAISLLKIRTYLEHRAHSDSAARTVIIADRGFLALLFLNNNYHAVHHDNPKLCWYRLPRAYAENQAQYLVQNDGYFYPSYRAIFRKYFFSRKDQVPHPIWIAKEDE